MDEKDACIANGFPFQIEMKGFYDQAEELLFLHDPYSDQINADGTVTFKVKRDS